jgi:predicted 2-oxoglutarate/Fe(II)-dependent dioxygenase YbiX
VGVDHRHFDLDQPFVWTVPGALSAAECAALVAQVEAADAWLPGTVNGAGGRVVRPELRSNSVALVDDAALGASLLARVRVPAVMSGRPLVGMKTRLRVYRYHPGEAFGLHRDQKYRGPDGERSELAVLVYLNDAFTGGRTFFPEARETIVPRTGMAVVFQNMSLHAGEQVLTGIKYVLRGDVFYAGA